MTYQIQKLNEVRLSDKAQQVYDYLLANPGKSIAETAEAAGLKESCVCGRVGDMLPLGLVWYETQLEGPKLLHATEDHEDQARNVRLYVQQEEGRNLNKMRQAANGLLTRFLPHERAQLRAIFERLNKEI